jgi:hypothetical protein
VIRGQIERLDDRCGGRQQRQHCEGGEQDGPDPPSIAPGPAPTMQQRGLQLPAPKRGGGDRRGGTRKRRPGRLGRLGRRCLPIRVRHGAEL